MQERRQAFRMQAVPDFDQVVLKVRDREIAARLYDTSATGLGIICEADVNIQPGDELKVRTDSGWFSVKVARISTTPEGRLLGLVRSWESANASSARKNESRLIAVVFAATVLAMPLLTVAWNHCRPQHPPAENPAQKAQLAAPPPAAPGGAPATAPSLMP
jgi:hypothetical protein